MNKKQQLRKQCDLLWKMAVVKMWGNKSVISGAPAQDPHHFFPKGNFGYLRYSLENGCPLTGSEHFAHHHKGDPTIHQRIIEVRGQKWYNELWAIAKEEHGSYQTVGWYERHIKNLKKYLERSAK